MDMSERISKKTFHCFFEQSGTFKNEFRKLGYEAFDYDISNDFNKTDFVIDLFKEIENAYNNKKSIFDNLEKDDEIIAFFPCVRFTEQILLWFRGDHAQAKNYTQKQKLEKNLEHHKELHYLYNLITKLVIVCIDKKIPLVIENPHGTQHYLTTHWSLKPKIIDKDRTIRGDYFVKPTQYFFVNREPSQNFIFEAYAVNRRKVIAKINGFTKEGKVERSMIAPEYANRFIREFII